MWFTELHTDQMSTENEEQANQSKVALKDESINSDDFKLKLIETADSLKI